MNERIQELAKEATKYANTYPGAQSFKRDEVWLAAYTEKFAELIIQKCANIAAINQAENMNWDIGEIIKEHFGVEN